MIIKVCELDKNFSCVYKISYPDNKVYIGCSSDLRRRMWEHNNLKKKRTLNDEAIEMFGRVEEVEVLFVSKDKSVLEEREAYYINRYDSTNPDKGYNVSKYGNAWGRKGDMNPLTKISDEEVIKIRKRKMLGESKKDVYRDYSSKITIHGFAHIWEGNTRTDITKDIVDYFNERSKSDKISTTNLGASNGRAVISPQDVIEIRRLYDNGTKITEISNIYNNISYTQLRRVCKRETWKHVN